MKTPEEHRGPHRTLQSKFEQESWLESNRVSMDVDRTYFDWPTIRSDDVVFWSDGQRFIPFQFTLDVYFPVQFAAPRTGFPPCRCSGWPSVPVQGFSISSGILPVNLWNELHDIKTCMHGMHTHIDTCMHAWHTHINTYMHSYIYTYRYMHAFIKSCSWIDMHCYQWRIIGFQKGDYFLSGHYCLHKRGIPGFHILPFDRGWY